MLLHVTFSLRRTPARDPEGECMVKTYGLRHVALAVPDLDHAFSFHSRVFGMKAVSRDATFLQAQTPGARDVVVFETLARGAGHEAVPRNSVSGHRPEDIDRGA